MSMKRKRRLTPDVRQSAIEWLKNNASLSYKEQLAYFSDNNYPINTANLTALRKEAGVAGTDRGESEGVRKKKEFAIHLFQTHPQMSNSQATQIIKAKFGSTLAVDRLKEARDLRFKLNGANPEDRQRLMMALGYQSSLHIMMSEPLDPTLDKKAINDLFGMISLALEHSGIAIVTTNRLGKEYVEVQQSGGNLQLPQEIRKPESNGSHNLTGKEAHHN